MHTQPNLAERVASLEKTASPFAFMGHLVEALNSLSVILQRSAPAEAPAISEVMLSLRDKMMVLYPPQVGFSEAFSGHGELAARIRESFALQAITQRRGSVLDDEHRQKVLGAFDFGLDGSERAVSEQTAFLTELLRLVKKSETSYTPLKVLSEPAGELIDSGFYLVPAAGHTRYHLVLNTTLESGIRLLATASSEGKATLHAYHPLEGRWYGADHHWVIPGAVVALERELRTAKLRLKTQRDEASCDFEQIKARVFAVMERARAMPPRLWEHYTGDKNGATFTMTEGSYVSVFNAVHHNPEAREARVYKIAGDTAFGFSQNFDGLPEAIKHALSSAIHFAVNQMVEVIDAFEETQRHAQAA